MRSWTIAYFAGTLCLLCEPRLPDPFWVQVLAVAPLLLNSRAKRTCVARLYQRLPTGHALRAFGHRCAFAGHFIQPRPGRRGLCGEHSGA